MAEDITLDVDESVADEAAEAIAAVNRITGGDEDAGYGGEEEPEASPAPQQAAEEEAEEGEEPKLTPTEQWIQRQRERDGGSYKELLERQRAETEQYKAYVNALLQAQAAREQGAPQEPEDPHPNIDPDVKKFLRDELQQVAQPLQTLEQQQRAAQEEYARGERMQRGRAAIEQMEQDYAQTEMGQGYHERVNQFRQAFIDEHRAWGEHFQVGLTEQQLQQEAQAQLEGMAMKAVQFGVPIPYAIDHYVRRWLGGGQNGAAPQQAQPPRRPASPEIAASRQAIQDGVTGVGTSRDHQVDAGAINIDTVIEKGLSAKDVAELAKGGDLTKRLAALAVAADRAMTED